MGMGELNAIEGNISPELLHKRALPQPHFSHLCLEIRTVVESSKDTEALFHFEPRITLGKIGSFTS